MATAIYPSPVFLVMLAIGLVGMLASRIWKPVGRMDPTCDFDSSLMRRIVEMRACTDESHVVPAGYDSSDPRPLARVRSGRLASHQIWQIKPRPILSHPVVVPCRREVATDDEPSSSSGQAMFAEKAGPILDLYAGLWKGKDLGPKDPIISADEKTSIQARLRSHPGLPTAPGRAGRVEHEYDRGGA